VIPATGGYVETCNNIDDDCDGTVDEPPAAPAVLCAAVPNATVACTAGTCRISLCNGGWYDTDGTYATGCECQGETIEGMPDCPSAYWLPLTFTDNPASDYTITGKITAAGDVDCFVFNATDTVDTTCDAYNVDIRFTSNPGNQFQFSVWRGASCATASCTGELSNYSWRTDFAGACVNPTGPAPCGECGCRTVVTAGYNLCADESSRYAFCVTRRPTFPATCDAYSVRVTNGVF